MGDFVDDVLDLVGRLLEKDLFDGVSVVEDVERPVTIGKLQELAIQGQVLSPAIQSTP